MAILTGKTEQGNLGYCRYENGVFTISPHIPYRIVRVGKTNTWHQLHMKAVGEIGEKIKVRIEWPLYDPALVPDEIKNAPNYEADWEPFAKPACDALFMSRDGGLIWEHVDNAELSGNVITFEATLPAKECLFAVTLYYTVARYRDLIASVKDSPFVKTEVIGIDEAGDEIYAFTAEDKSVPTEKKTFVHLQAAQHCSEYNGAHVCDFMLRFLASGSPEARQLLSRYVFTFIPVCSVSGWREGADVHTSGKNPNRDWVNKELPSTKAIHGFLTSLAKKPALLLDIHSGLANYGSWEICQALSVTPNIPEEKKNEMRRFVDIVYENTDFLPTRRYWEGPVDDTMFDGYGMNYGQTHTMEISFYAFYDKAAGRHFPIGQKALEKFSKELAFAIDSFFTEK